MGYQSSPWLSQFVESFCRPNAGFNEGSVCIMGYLGIEWKACTILKVPRDMV